MGEVVDWSCSAAVEFDDHAMAMVGRMAGVLYGTALIMGETLCPTTEKKGVEIIDDMAPHTDLICEHIDVLEQYADDILNALTEDEEGYFSNDSKLQKFTVMSIIKRKCRTIRVQRFFVTKSGHKAVQDNDKIALECHDGALACRMETVHPIATRMRARAARA